MANTNFEITGKIVEIYNTQHISDKFSKREFVLEVQDGNFPQFVTLQLTGDKCDIIANFRKGETVTAKFNLQGRKYEKNGETKYFTTLGAWKIDGANGQKPAQPQAQNKSVAQSDDELPF